MQFDVRWEGKYRREFKRLGNSFALDARSANGDYQITRPTNGAFTWLI